MIENVPAGPNPAVDFTVRVWCVESIVWLLPSIVVNVATPCVSWKKSPSDGSSGNAGSSSIVVHCVPSKRWIRSAPLMLIVASMSRPFELIVAFPVVATFVRVTELTATPAPMPTVPASVDLPLPSAVATVFAVALIVTAPVDVMLSRPRTTPWTA